MEPLDTNFQDDKTIFTSAGARYVRKMAPWARFMSILSWIGAAFCVFAGVGMLFGTSQLANEPAFQQEGISAMFLPLAIFYIVIAVVYGIVGYWTWRFQDNSLAAAQLNSSVRLEGAYKMLYRIFLLFGIFTILGIVGYIIAIGFVFSSAF